MERLIKIALQLTLHLSLIILNVTITLHLQLYYFDSSDYDLNENGLRAVLILH